MEKNQTPVTAYVMLETRWPNAKQIYKTKLMITHKRVQKYYTIIIPGVPAEMSKDEFNKIKQLKPRKPFSDYKERINLVEADARAVITDMVEFSFEEFEKRYFDPPKDEKSLFGAMEDYIQQLKLEGRVGTASSYVSTLNSMRKFTEVNKLRNLTFDMITVSLLKEWEKWMIDEGNNSTSVGIYARNIRAILNKGKDAGLMKPENYPFGKNKYEIPAGSNVKKALTASEVGKIFNYPLIEGSTEQRSRDLWIFSYLCNGINMKDIARLKYKNIDDEAIVFVRAKTERKQRQNQKSIIVPVGKEIKQIIKRWGNVPVTSEMFVFPILHDGITAEKERALIQQATKTINKYIKRIAENLKITKEVTTYTARHSFATVMKRSGASIEFISESLGHSNTGTTENYLASFELDTKKKLAKNLLKFK